MKTLFTLTFSLISLFAFSQKQQRVAFDGWKLQPVMQQMALQEPLSLGEDQRIAWLLRTAGYGEDIQLVEAYRRQAQAFEHRGYDLYRAGHRIFAAQLKLTLDAQGRIKACQYPQFNNSTDQSSFPSLADAERTMASRSGQQILKHEELYFLHPQGYLSRGLRLEVGGSEEIHRELILHNNEVVYDHDLLRYAHHHNAGPNDTLVDVYVFNPDPLTTAQENYGGVYSDKNDGDTPQLNNERQLKQCVFSYVNGAIAAENDFVKISEFSLPNISPVNQGNSNVFDYTRGDDHFEDVNVMYHISQHREHLSQLGYPSLPNYQIEVDAHALSNADQSFFSTAVYPHRLYFGEGGVDDAEDADVILHEFSHAVIYEAAPSLNFTTERGCIEEALCDYFAMSYSMSESMFQYDKVFNWDGHNSFWSGRSGKTSTTYDKITFASGNIYLYTAVLVNPLLNINMQLGRATSDELVTEALYFLNSSTTMPQFAEHMLMADTALNAGMNTAIIRQAFIDQGILNPLPVSVNEWEEQLPWRISGQLDFARGGSLQVELIDGNELQLELYELGGKRLQAGSATPSVPAYLNASELKPGVYILLLHHGNGQRQSIKLSRF